MRQIELDEIEDRFVNDDQLDDVVKDDVEALITEIKELWATNSRIVARNITLEGELVDEERENPPW